VTSRNPRTCKNYERLWKGRCVDKNLQDTWLEELNRLKMLELISICEGHSEIPTYRPRAFAHISLRFNTAATRRLTPQWDQLKNETVQAVDSIFSTEKSRIKFVYNVSIRKGFLPLRSSTRIVLRIQSKEPRLTKVLDPKASRWFEEVILQVKKFDSFLQILRPDNS
jgi:hypothetical protein